MAAMLGQFIHGQEVGGDSGETIWINTCNITHIEMPSGGYKQSGVGRENSLVAIDHYTQRTAVYVETGDVDAPY